MMSLRKSTLSMLLLTAAVATLSIGAAACSGGGDDDDDGSTQIPNPYEGCLVFWDHYSGDQPTDPGSRMGIIGDLAWYASGTGAINGNEALGFLLYDGVFGAAAVFTATYESTSGSVTLTAPSNSLHEPVDITIGSAWSWHLTEGTGGNVSGGLGDGSGFFNDTDDCFGDGDFEDCIQSTGDVDFMVGTTAASAGAGATPFGFAVTFCRDFSAFQGSTLHERAMNFAKQYPRIQN